MFNDTEVKPVYKKRIIIKKNYKLYVICAIVVLLIGITYSSLAIKLINDIQIDMAIAKSISDYQARQYIERCEYEYANEQTVKQLIAFHDSSSNDVNYSSQNISSDINTKSYNVPQGHSFKSFTYYTSLSEHSPQGELQKLAYTDENGLRKVDEYYCAALGTFYEGDIGDRYLITLSTGVMFKMILCDIKSDVHTDSAHQYTRNNGCMIEFYVDYDKLNLDAKLSGDISNIEGFEGSIINIEKIIYE